MTSVELTPNHSEFDPNPFKSEAIDSETQALLNLLVDSIANARILLLVNYRPEYQHG